VGSKNKTNLHLREDVGDLGVWVVLGVEHHDGNSGGSSEQSSSSNDNTESPVWQQGKDGNGSLLVTVGEVVVSGGHEVEGSSLVHSDNSSIEISVSSVQFSAISDIIVLVSSDLRSWEAVSLVEMGHSESQFWGFEQNFLWVVKNPLVSDWVRGPWVWDLDTVSSVSSVSSFSSISGWVGVASGPLEVDVISNSGIQVLWDKVVFSGWVGLDDVSSLSSNIQVEDSGQSGNSIGSLGDSEDVRSVFEGSSELGGILSKGEFKKGIFVDDGVLLNWGGISIELGVNESRSWVRHIIESVFSGGNVVSNSESTAASCIRFGAVFSRGNGPVVVVVESWILLSISEVVFSGPWGLDTFGSSDSPGCLFFPGISG